MNFYDFKSRVAIVTGGGQGIGRTVAERILAGGGSVCIWDRDAALLEKTVAELGEPTRIHGIPVDIGDLAAVEAGTAETMKRFGQIDVY